MFACATAANMVSCEGFGMWSDQCISEDLCRTMRRACLGPPVHTSDGAGENRSICGLLHSTVVQVLEMEAQFCERHVRVHYVGNFLADEW